MTNNLKDEYASLTEPARHALHKLAADVCALVESSDVSLCFPVTWRFKTWESVEQKLKRLGLTLASP